MSYAGTYDRGVGMARSQRVRGMIAFAGAAMLALGLAACAPDSSVGVDTLDQVDGPLPEAVRTEMQTAVERAVAGSASTGAVVGVWVPWAGTWMTGVGAVAPDGAAADETDLFRAGDVTRAMTCDVLYALVHEGTVALDDTVGEYVSGQPHEESLTLGQLCDSTTGLASYEPLVTKRAVANPPRTWNPRELVAYGTASSPAELDPGAKFVEADTNYALLGLALERATNSTAADLLEKYVFEPSGMSSSSLPTRARSDLGGFLSAKTKTGGDSCTNLTDLSDLSPSLGFTAAGVSTDLADLGAYTRALATGARSYDTDSRFDDALPAYDTAPSWFTAKGGTYQAGTLIGQYGKIPGAMTAAFADRNTGMTVVVTLNNSRASAALVRSLAWELAAIASKVPAAEGRTAPDAGLPFTAEHMAEQVAGNAICPIP